LFLSFVEVIIHGLLLALPHKAPNPGSFSIRHIRGGGMKGRIVVPCSCSKHTYPIYVVDIESKEVVHTVRVGGAKWVRSLGVSLETKYGDFAASLDRRYLLITPRRPVAVIMDLKSGRTVFEPYIRAFFYLLRDPTKLRFFWRIGESAKLMKNKLVWDKRMRERLLMEGGGGGFLDSRKVLVGMSREARIYDLETGDALAFEVPQDIIRRIIKKYDLDLEISAYLTRNTSESSGGRNVMSIPFISLSGKVNRVRLCPKDSWRFVRLESWLSFGRWVYHIGVFDFREREYVWGVFLDSLARRVIDEYRSDIESVLGADRIVVEPERYKEDMPDWWEEIEDLSLIVPRLKVFGGRSGCVYKETKAECRGFDVDPEGRFVVVAYTIMGCAEKDGKREDFEIPMVVWLDINSGKLLGVWLCDEPEFGLIDDIQMLPGGYTVVLMSRRIYVLSPSFKLHKIFDSALSENNPHKVFRSMINCEHFFAIGSPTVSPDLKYIAYTFTRGTSDLHKEGLIPHWSPSVFYDEKFNYCSIPEKIRKELRTMYVIVYDDEWEIATWTKIYDKEERILKRVGAEIFWF